MQSCAASVLLWAITSAGRWTCSMAKAMVAVLPEPVTPSSVWKRSPASMPLASPATALRLIGNRPVCGIDLELGHGLLTLATGVVGPRVPVRHS